MTNQNEAIKAYQFFAAIMHLSEVYGEQYREKNLCLSPEQNTASFDEFVDQYYRARIRGKYIRPVININVPLSYVKRNWYEDSRLCKLDSDNPFRVIFVE